MHGKVLFKYGTMSSGKSMHLLATAHNFQEHSIPFLIFKSEIDTRDGDNVIHSRAIGDRECLSISSDDNLFYLISEYLNSGYTLCQKRLQWILVDEAQFLTEKQVDELAAIADTFNINVICYGLRTDFQTHLFTGSRRLFEIADSIEEIKSSCYCGSKTIFNARINDKNEIVTEGNQIEIGGDDKYTSLCRQCYFKRINHPLYKDSDGKSHH